MATPLLDTWRSARKRFGVRLVAGMLAISLPGMAVLAVLLTKQASHSLSSASQRKGQSVARAVTVRLEDWLSERRESLSVVAAQGGTTELNGHR